MELKEQKNQGAKAINLGSQSSPAGTILACEQIESILIVRIFKINLTYGHTHLFFQKENSKSGTEPRLDTNYTSNKIQTDCNYVCICEEVLYMSQLYSPSILQEEFPTLNCKAGCQQLYFRAFY